MKCAVRTQRDFAIAYALSIAPRTEENCKITIDFVTKVEK